jgi:hypothetical protein
MIQVLTAANMKMTVSGMLAMLRREVFLHLSVVHLKTLSQ